MKRSLVVLGLATALLGASLMAAAAPAPAATPPSPPASAPPALTPAATDTAAGNTAFAADLYSRLSKTDAGQNLFLSPYSISAALAMTAQGARGDTAAQMNKVLHIGPNFQAGMAEITPALHPQDAPFDLSVANNLWVDQTFPLSEAFVADCRKNYDAGIVGVDFLHNAQPARIQINAAVAAQTHDKIKDLLPADAVNHDTALILTNAIYFKGAWQTAFPKAATTDQPFHIAGGTDITVPLMKSPPETRYGYAETDSARSSPCPTKARPRPTPALAAARCP